MATVITNLLSAIPFIGNDIVPLSIILPIYLSIFILLINIYILFKVISQINYSITKNSLTREAGMSPEVTIDNISIKNNNKLTDKSLLPKIDKDLLALFIGFVDGDGYIRVTKKPKDNINYIFISLIINLNINELELLNYFKTHLNMGNVYSITPKKGNKIARLEINKTDIFNILIPLLDHYNYSFLTEQRQNQYLKVKYIKNNKIKFYEDILENDLLNLYIKNNKIISNLDSNDIKLYNNLINLSYFNN